MGKRKDGLASIVPEDFGRNGGTPIDNIDTVLAEIDRAAAEPGEEPHPPAVEYILIRPYALVRIPFTTYGVSYNAFGHAVVRYRLDGQDHVINIVGKSNKGTALVTDNSPSEYLFGTQIDLTEQGGVYNRDIYGVRVEQWPEDKVRAMHEYFTNLTERDKQGQATFNILFGPLYNIIRYIFPTTAERGNCASWISGGLRAAELTSHRTLWPASIWVDMFENLGSNATVVHYRQVLHAPLEYGRKTTATLAAIAPLQALRNFFYMDMSSFARVVVSVPDGTTHANVERVEPTAFPSAWRNIVNSKAFIAGSTLVTGGVLLSATLAAGRQRHPAAVLRTLRARWTERLRNAGK